MESRWRNGSWPGASVDHLAEHDHPHRHQEYDKCRQYKPALLRQLFDLGSRYSAQILSYNKMLGQLQDAGNTTTLAHYLDLLEAAGMVRGLQKFSGSEVRSRGSSPKLEEFLRGRRRRRPVRSLGEGRTHQLRSLLEHLGGAAGILIGGDLNTWWGGADEDAVRTIMESFNGTPDPPEEGTLHVPVGLPDPTMDYLFLFFDLPAGWEGRYDVVEERYGSDHRPVVGAIWNVDAGGPQHDGAGGAPSVPVNDEEGLP